MMHHRSLQPAVNLEELREIMDDNVALIQECFSDFLRELPGLTQALYRAVEEKDDASVERLAHKIKGSLQYLAAHAAAGQARELEELAKKGLESEYQPKLDALLTRCGELEAFIRDFGNLPPDRQSLT